MDTSRLGGYIRERRLARALSLRKLSGLAGVSIAYLSQVERGLRRPSADILQSIARALQVSAETLYVQAGIMEERSAAPAPDVVAALMADPTISGAQRRAMIQIYHAFREDAAGPPDDVRTSGPGTNRGERR